VKRQPRRSYRPPPLPLFAALGLMAGCAEDYPGIVAADPGPPERCGLLAVAPEALDFGQLVPGVEVVQQVIHICNEGGDDMWIAPVEISVDAAGLVVQDDPASDLLGPTECMDQTIELRPVACTTVEGELLVLGTGTYSDCAMEEVRVPVSAEVGAGEEDTGCGG
jgi:hypothetical protein